MTTTNLKPAEASGQPTRTDGIGEGQIAHPEPPPEAERANQGVGDWRPEKGSGNFGQFELVSEDDADYLRIIETGGRQEQIDAMESPTPYDQDTEELLEWFNDEIDRRGKVVAIK